MKNTNYGKEQLVPLLFKLRYFEQDTKIKNIENFEEDNIKYEVSKEERIERVKNFFKKLNNKELNTKKSGLNDIDEILREKLYIHKSIFSLDIDDLIRSIGTKNEDVVVMLAQDNKITNILREVQLEKMEKQIMYLKEQFKYTSSTWEKKDKKTKELQDLKTEELLRKDVFFNFQRDFLKQVLNITEEEIQTFFREL
jgi:hypothetical protein